MTASTLPEMRAAAQRVASRKLYQAVDRLYVRCRADSAARGAVRRAARGFGGQAAYVDMLRVRSEPRFFVGVEEIEAGAQRSSSMTASLREAADRLRRRGFRLLGTDIEFGSDILWAIEPATGRCWPTGEYHVDFLRRTPDRAEYGDLRRTWELNRFLHVPLLGRIHHLVPSEDDWCAREFRAQVESWIASNPYGRGPNWASTMDVSIRMINFIWGYALFRGYESIPPAFWTAHVESIWQHARHIERHPQSATIPDNHHVSHFLGLFYAGLLFPELPRARRWFELGRDGLVAQMDAQLYEDGVQHECTTNYQKLVAEMFLHAWLLADRNGCRFSESYRERLIRMFSVLVEVEQPDGLTPTFGDSDNGRLQDVASAAAPNDYRPVLTAAAGALERPELLPRAGAMPELAQMLCGEAATDTVLSKARRDSTLRPRTPAYASFPDGGYFSVHLGDAHLIVRGGPFGLRGHGGHSHNDQLAFVYWFGRPIFVDPGILGYSGHPPDEIAYFRSTAAHNTLSVDATEQLPTPPALSERPRYSPYANRPIPQVIEESTGGTDAWRLVLEHYYYYGEMGVVHRRSFELDRGGRRLQVTDQVEGTDVHDLSWSFHLAAGLEATQIAEGVAVHSGGEAVGVLRVANELRDAVTIDSTPRAAAYGELSHAPTVRVEVSDRLPMRTHFVFECSAADAHGSPRVASS